MDTDLRVCPDQLDFFFVIDILMDYSKPGINLPLLRRITMHIRCKIFRFPFNSVVFPHERLSPGIRYRP